MNASGAWLMPLHVGWALPEEPPPSPGGGRPSRPSQPSSPPPGTVHTYALAGGRVTLLITRASVRLVGAAPVPCFSVQTWSTAGWLRVDFSRGTAVSSLTATWNSHAPAVQVFSD
jgi:hypothetical protein